jgi:hypothetical protein
VIIRSPSASEIPSEEPLSDEVCLDVVALTAPAP